MKNMLGTGFTPMLLRMLNMSNNLATNQFFFFNYFLQIKSIRVAHASHVQGKLKDMNVRVCTLKYDAFSLSMSMMLYAMFLS